MFLLQTRNPQKAWVAWSEALFGDLVFYPDDIHVGIVIGWDENGKLLLF